MPWFIASIKSRKSINVRYSKNYNVFNFFCIFLLIMGKLKSAKIKNYKISQNHGLRDHATVWFYGNKEEKLESDYIGMWKTQYWKVHLFKIIIIMRLFFILKLMDFYDYFILFYSIDDDGRTPNT